MPGKIVRIGVFAAGAFSSLVIILFSIQEVSSFFIWKSSGVAKTQFLQQDDDSVIFSDVDTADFVSPPIPDSGEVIIMMDDTLASIDYVRQNIYKGYKPGKQLNLSYIHDGDTLSTIIRTRPVEKAEIFQDLPVSGLRLLIVIGYLVVGLWAFSKRPDSGAIRALTLFCIAMAGFIITVVTINRDNITGLQVPSFDILGSIFSALGLFFGAFWLNLQFLFPKQGEFMRKHSRLAYILCYLPIIILIPLLMLLQFDWLSIVLICVIMIQVWAGFILLARNHIKAGDQLEKRQTRLVLWGTGVGLFGMFILLVVGIFFRGWFAGLDAKYILGIINLEFLALLVSPLSFAYAFGRYRLLEVEGKIRRGTRFVLVTIVLLFVFYLAIYGVSEVVLGSIGVESRGPVLLIALVLAIGFIPAQRKVQSFAESRIYPERNRLRQMLREFLSHSIAYADKKAFWNELEAHLRNVLDVEDIYTLLYEEKEDVFCDWQTGAVSPFTSESKLAAELKGLKSCPLMLDEALAGENLTMDEESWLNERKIIMILPLQTRTQLVGFIGLGFKSDREEFNAEECGMLMSIASQVAVAAENLQLLEENIEKQRLEKELGMARRVQQGLLPGRIPDAPGLDIAARSKFCLEVAGDYYDIINIDGRYTVIAIGDVSGKGAAAALLMSNIQASFRIAADIGFQVSDPDRDINVSNVVSRINDLIHSNTAPDQFITFFAGIFDSENKTFSYVNAGHNPPMILRSTGGIEMMDKGGLLLGVMPNVAYEQDTVNLQTNDLLFLYTDGVSEAENANGEMYGEERIQAVISEYKNQEPDMILSKLEEEVQDFIAEVPLSDDFTTLIAKVTS
jgi:serine phosphatase RsbU (regulator of sigma subunit)